jgi:hypothetical protein
MSDDVLELWDDDQGDDWDVRWLVRTLRRRMRWWAHMSDYVSGLSDEDRGDELRCLMTCPEYQDEDRVVGLRVWWRVRTMKAWTEMLGPDSDDVSGLWRHGSRCWIQILMTCQDYEGIDRGVDLRCLMTCQVHEASDRGVDLRCLMTCQVHEANDRGVDLRCLMTCQVHEANDRGVEGFRSLMTCKWLAEKSRRWLLRCLGFSGDKSRWRSRCGCKVVSLASKRRRGRRKKKRGRRRERFQEKREARRIAKDSPGIWCYCCRGNAFAQSQERSRFERTPFRTQLCTMRYILFLRSCHISPDLTAICFLSFLFHVNIMLFCWIVAPSLPHPPLLLLFNFLFTGFTRLMLVYLLCTMVLFALLFYHCQVFFTILIHKVELHF